MFGDDMNFCIEPRGCHSESGECYCEYLETNTTTFVTKWNNTEDICSVEYFMDIEEFPVNSWYAELEFENAAEILDIWRAKTAMDSPDYTHRYNRSLSAFSIFALPQNFSSWFKKYR